LYAPRRLAALSIVVSIGFMRFWRARVVDSSARLSLHQSAGKATFPPLLRLYDAYLDWDAGGEVSAIRRCSYTRPLASG
jgi:hypothetical protein